MRLRSSHHVPHALEERRGLQWAARVGLTPHTPQTRADVRRRRVSHRAPALRPHLTHQISTRVQCAHNRDRIFFDIFGPPKICVGVGPSPGFAVLQLVLVWQAKKAVAKKEAAEEAAQVPSSQTGCIRSPSHCERRVLIMR